MKNLTKAIQMTIFHQELHFGLAHSDASLLQGVASSSLFPTWFLVANLKYFETDFHD
jgi:hypothetical protein